mgnify:FL=1
MPGSFDPVTIGHYDVARRAAEIFDRLYVVAFVNSEKHGRFQASDRLRLLEAAFADIPYIHCELSDGLLADYAVRHVIGVLVKGARGSVDFDYELSLSLINRAVEPELDTIILPTRQEYLHISSTMVSEMIKYGRDYSDYVPSGALRLLHELTKKK